MFSSRSSKEELLLPQNSSVDLTKPKKKKKSVRLWNGARQSETEQSLEDPGEDHLQIDAYARNLEILQR